MFIKNKIVSKDTESKIAASKGTVAKDTESKIAASKGTVAKDTVSKSTAPKSRNFIAAMLALSICASAGYTGQANALDLPACTTKLNFTGITKLALPAFVSKIANSVKTTLSPKSIISSWQNMSKFNKGFFITTLASVIVGYFAYHIIPLSKQIIWASQQPKDKKFANKLTNNKEVSKTEYIEIIKKKLFYGDLKYAFFGAVLLATSPLAFNYKWLYWLETADALLGVGWPLTTPFNKYCLSPFEKYCLSPIKEKLKTLGNKLKKNKSQEQNQKQKQEHNQKQDSKKQEKEDNGEEKEAV